MLFTLSITTHTVRFMRTLPMPVRDSVILYVTFANRFVVGSMSIFSGSGSAKCTLPVANRFTVGNVFLLDGFGFVAFETFSDGTSTV